jgi:hypothetical protein
MVGSNASAVEVAFKSELTNQLSAGAVYSSFQGAHTKVAQYSTYYDRIALSGSAGLNLASATEITKTLVKQGDLILGAYVEVNGPLLATVSSAASTQAGVTGNAKKLIVDDLFHASALLGQAAVASGLFALDDASAVLNSQLMTLKKLISNYLVDAVSDVAETGAQAKNGTANLQRYLADYFNISHAIAQYTDYSGAAAIKSFVFSVANETQDTITPVDIIGFNEYWSENKMAGQAMHHGSRGELIAWSAREVQFLVHIPIWFGRSLAQRFNLTGHHGHTVGVTITFEQMYKLIEGSSTTVSALTTQHKTVNTGGITLELMTTTNGTLGTAITPLGIDGTGFPATALAATHFSAALWLQKARVTRNERKQLFNAKEKQVISVHKQLMTLPLTNAQCTAGSLIETSIYPKLNVQAMYLYAQKGSALAQNRLMDFSGVRSSLYEDTEAKRIVATYALSLNGDPKFSMSPYQLETMTVHASGANTSSFKGLGLFHFGSGDPYSLQKSSGSLPSIKFENIKLGVTPDANACTDHTGEGGISGETATVYSRGVCLQVYELENGGGGVVYH